MREAAGADKKTKEFGLSLVPCTSTNYARPRSVFQSHQDLRTHSVKAGKAQGRQSPVTESRVVLVGPLLQLGQNVMQCSTYRVEAEIEGEDVIVQQVPCHDGGVHPGGQAKGEVQQVQQDGGRGVVVNAVIV